jgi:hypothetical protein
MPGLADGDWCCWKDVLMRGSSKRVNRVLLEGLESRILMAGNYVVDLLAVYTPESRVAAGGIAGILAQIEEEVASTNLALSNSLIPITVRLVAASQVPYWESGNLGTDLDRMVYPNDGYLDTVPVLRNYFHADVVAMFASQSDFYDEGISFLLAEWNPNRQADAYAVIDQSAPADHYLLAHELGHVFGAGHALSDYGAGGSTSYANGYRFTGNDAVLYHDVMAYDPGTILPYYSNPRITYAGKPLGTANADNAKTLTLFAPLVSAYRSAPTVLGKVEIARGTMIAGWATDPKDLDGAATVMIVIDGAIKATISANDTRSDLATLLGSADHGYSYTPVGLAAGSHKAAVYAVDSKSGVPKLIGSKNFVVRRPVGAISAVSRTEVSGWVVDQDTPSRAVTVTILVDGVSVGTMVANAWRPGLIQTYGSASHGFKFGLPSLSAGPHRVTVLGTDTETGVLGFIGSRIV